VTRKRLACFAFAATLVLVVGMTAQAALIDLTKIRGTYVYPTQGQRILLKGASALKSVGPWASGITLAMTLARLLLEDTNGNGTNMVPGPNAPYPGPDGWPGPNSPPGSIPLSGQGTYLGNIDVTSCGTVGSQLGAKAWTSTGYQYEIHCAPANSGEVGINNCTGMAPSCPGGFYPGLFRKDLTCPAGYTFESGSCHLSNPASAKWPADGVPTIQPTGPGWEAHPRDPDPVTPGLIQGSDVVRSGSDEYGNPQRETWHNNGDGTITGKQVTQGEAQDGNTNVNEKGITIDSDGRITNITNTTANNTTITNYNNSGGGAVNLQLPTDYARENTLQDIRTKLSDVPAAPAEDQYKSKADGINQIKDSLQTYTSPEGPGSIQGLFPAGGGCQQVHWAFLNKSYAFPGEVGCQWFTEFKLWFGWALYIMTAVYLYRLASATAGRTG
jgi:hypothetical protein